MLKYISFIIVYIIGFVIVTVVLAGGCITALLRGIFWDFRFTLMFDNEEMTIKEIVVDIYPDLPYQLWIDLHDWFYKKQS